MANLIIGSKLFLYWIVPIILFLFFLIIFHYIFSPIDFENFITVLLTINPKEILVFFLKLIGLEGVLISLSVPWIVLTTNWLFVEIAYSIYYFYIVKNRVNEMLLEKTSRNTPLIKKEFLEEAQRTIRSSTVLYLANCILGSILLLVFLFKDLNFILYVYGFISICCSLLVVFKIEEKIVQYYFQKINVLNEKGFNSLWKIIFNF